MITTKTELPKLPDTFFNADFFELMTGYVKWFMKYNMPIFMMCMAVLVAYLVLDMIADVNVEAKRSLDRDGRRRRDDDDDDDD